MLLEQKPFAGLQSYACWGSRPTPDRIEMRDLVTGEVFPIGTPGQGHMEPIPEALDSHAAAILRKIPDGSDVMIDEVGYLESSCARYAKELERLLDRCTVIAALRKDHTPLLDRLRSRPDVFVWDLDLHQHPCQVGCVVMASGWSRRFSGENKLLLPVDGKPMIRHTLEKLAALPLERVTVVSRYEPVREMAAEYGFQALDNPLMLQSDTIRLGLAEMAEMDGCMLCVADQPYCTRESMEALLRLFRENPDRICRLSFRGQPGNPAIFPWALFAEISALTGDTGAREVIRRYPDRVLMLETADAEELHDIDRPEDLPGTSPAE